MRRVMGIALALLSTAVQALDLKGVRLGMTQAELQAAFPAGHAAGVPRPNGMLCLSATFCSVDVGTIAQVATVLQVRFLDGKVADAYAGHLSPVQFDQVVDALRSKYGPPASTAMTQVHNRLGNTFDNPHYVWKFPEGELRASRFLQGPSTLDYAELRITSTAWIANEAAQRQTRNADL